MEGSGHATVVHHHFVISHEGNERRAARLDTLSQTQDLLVTSGLERNSQPTVHEHRFHQLPDDIDLETLKEKMRAKEPNKRHCFYDSFRSVDAVVSSPLSHLLEDVSQVRRCLRWAMRIELATIPPYIYALYSLKDQKCFSAMLLKSIAAEEMLHAGLVANLLVAMGGQPTFFFDERSMCTSYPVSLQHMGGLSLALLPMGVPCLDQFLALEKPSGVAVANATSRYAATGEFESVGHLYGALESAIERLAREGVELFGRPRPELQLKSHNYKLLEHNVAESGGLHPVLNLSDARAALATIVSQGEGLHDTLYADESHSELTHYSKVLAMRARLETGEGDAVHDVPCNPRLADCGDPAVALLGRCFNAAYAALLLSLQELYAEEDSSGRLNRRMYGLMEKVMRPVGVLMCQKGFGPTFEPVYFEDSPMDTVKRLCLEAVALFPEHLHKTAEALHKLG